METAADAPAAPTTRTPAYAWFVLLVLMTVYIFNFLDRQLMSTLQEEIKRDLELTDAQLGLMTGFFFALFYTGFGVIVGFLADRTSRVRILAAGCFLWSMFTALCGLAKTFPTMAVARIGVGVGEAAGAPPSYSIVSDYFPAHKRGLALAIFSMGVPFGMALGTAIGAGIASADNLTWRDAFIYIGMAGVVASVLLLVLVREPKRGAMDAKPAVATGPGTDEIAKEESTSFVATIGMFFSNPVLLWTSLGCGLSAFVGYAYLNWNASMLLRVKEMSLEDLSRYYALMLAVSMGLGTILSGAIVDFMVKRSKIWYGLLPAIAMALCIPFHLVYVGTEGWVASLLVLAVPTFLNIMYLAPALAVVQNWVKPNQRTMAGALLLMVLNLIGLGGGPTLMGFMSTYFSAEHGPVEGLKMAFYALTPFFVLAVIFLLLMARAIGKQVKEGKIAA